MLQDMVFNTSLVVFNFTANINLKKSAVFSYLGLIKHKKNIINISPLIT